MKQEIEREIELRRHRKTLTVLGAGVIAFGFWSLMKSFMTAVDDPASLINATDPENLLLMAAVLTGGILLLTGADLLLRIYVGTSAIRAGRGAAPKRLRLWGFIVLAGLGVFAILVDSIILVLALFFNNGDIEVMLKIPDMAVTLIGDLTGFLIQIQLTHAAVQVRKLTKEQYAD